MEDNNKNNMNEFDFGDKDFSVNEKTKDFLKMVKGSGDVSKAKKISNAFKSGNVPTADEVKYNQKDENKLRKHYDTQFLSTPKEERANKFGWNKIAERAKAQGLFGLGSDREEPRDLEEIDIREMLDIPEDKEGNLIYPEGLADEDREEYELYSYYEPVYHALNKAHPKANFSREDVYKWLQRILNKK